MFKPSRMLVEERPLDAPSFETPTKGSTSPPPSSLSPVNGTRVVSKKSSFRRISEVLQPGTPTEKGIGGKKDIWLVVFTDVVLRCQRTGVTSLPLGGGTNGSGGNRTTSMPDIQGKGPKSPTNPKRAAAQARTRNLYRFVKVESWTLNQKPKPRELVSKEA